MERIIKLFRFIAFLFLLVLASTGLGMGSAFGNSREKYIDREIRIEQAEKKEEDGDLELKDTE